MAEPTPLIEWLLDSDPAIRWQVLRDLLDAPEAEWSAERSRVEVQGWGARLFAAQDPDGQWAGGAFVPSDFEPREWREVGQPWTATCFVLTQLRELGLEPASPRGRRTIALVGANARWDEGGQPFWSGEVEECINGRTVADGAYFGVDVAPIVERLCGERQPDGGWNCERANGSTRSSFDTTINVLEGLLEFERGTGGTAASREARRAGEEFLLERGLFRRLSTGEPADPSYLRLAHPNRWHYDILRGLDYFRSAGQFTGTAPDPRLTAALEVLIDKRRPDGVWNLEWVWHGRTWLELDDGPGQPSRWDHPASAAGAALDRGLVGSIQREGSVRMQAGPPGEPALEMDHTYPTHAEPVQHRPGGLVVDLGECNQPRACPERRPLQVRAPADLRRQTATDERPVRPIAGDPLRHPIGGPLSHHVAGPRFGRFRVPRAGPVVHQEIAVQHQQIGKVGQFDGRQPQANRLDRLGRAEPTQPASLRRAPIAVSRSVVSQKSGMDAFRKVP